ncbi:MAG: Type 1 glutamine amidotransferase-like domain-containing protein [Minisyncoccia bacterium]
MKFYLSSYALGNETEKLKALIPHKKIGYIANARDYSNPDVEHRKNSVARDVAALKNLGIEVEEVDLKNYFNKKHELKKKIEDLGAIFISGGNVFILRQAMKLSGLDEILKGLKDENTDFLYAGYSAAGCVLAPSLRAFPIVDNSEDHPYEELNETIWEGLGFVDFAFMPHYKSDHPESTDVDKEIEFCKENNIPFKAIRDGEVIIID